MPKQENRGLGFYSTVLRLWFFIVAAIVLIVVLFPIRLPLCGTGGKVVGNKMTTRDFVVMLGANLAAGSILVRIRSMLLFVLSVIVALALIDWSIAQVFSLDLRFDPRTWLMLR